MKFPTSKILNSERCTLRHISKEDIPHIFAASRYPGFTDGMLWEPPGCEEELLPRYEDNVKAWLTDQAYCFTIEINDTGDFIGRVAIRRQDEENVWDLGFWTHPEKQGNGYMSEAVRAVIAFGFQELAANRIIAAHALWNKASERVLKKNGLRFAQHIPNGFMKRGDWVEENLLAITRSEWRELQRRSTDS